MASQSSVALTMFKSDQTVTVKDLMLNHLAAAYD